jgi:hypothetical protein
MEELLMLKSMMTEEAFFKKFYISMKLITKITANVAMEYSTIENGEN